MLDMLTPYCGMVPAMSTKHIPRVRKSPFIEVKFDKGPERWATYNSGTVIYEISNYGRVRRYLHPFVVDDHMYPQVYLSGRAKVHIHTLVAECFIGKRPPGLVINHKDNDTLNSHESNLEYVTQSENMRLAHATGRCSKRGPDTKPRRLTTKQERFLIVEAVRRGDRKIDVARAFNTSSTFVGWLCKHPVYGLRAERLQ